VILRQNNHVKQRWQIITDNLRKFGWRCGCISSTDHEGCQFWVVPQSVRTPDASLCMPMKSSPRFLNWNLRFALALIYLDTPTRFLKTRRRYTGLNGRRTLPAGVLRPFWGPPRSESNCSGEKERNLLMALHASWIHGNALAVESPESLTRVGHLGNGADMLTSRYPHL